MDYYECLEKLRQSLELPLPGKEAQIVMAPRPRIGWKPGKVPGEARQAGVLILFYSKNEEAHFPLTRRSEELPSHQGQISLPGGAQDEGETLEETALRETCEELGLCQEIDILGRLSELYIPGSRFVITPVVACTNEVPQFKPRREEVAEVIELPITKLLSPDTVRLESRNLSIGKTWVPFFDIDGAQVWGATSMVLAELIAVLGHSIKLPDINMKSD